MCRGLPRNFSMYTVGLPNAACASARVSVTADYQRRFGVHDAHPAPAARRRTP